MSLWLAGWRFEAALPESNLNRYFVAWFRASAAGSRSVLMRHGAAHADTDIRWSMELSRNHAYSRMLCLCAFVCSWTQSQCLAVYSPFPEPARVRWHGVDGHDRTTDCEGKAESGDTDCMVVEPSLLVMVQRLTYV
jgi:hypothetical protein